ncbi:Nucleotide-binding universal stress protein, UspA family [Desulfocicer vacuolatum DSM 3385]|uniref:Nucleotide-binding universal stress protein, UspA family n=1 Tax=Desulfocicer vacuolatum DSM 3385 TaxID=1121400 RepID=A0A1W2DTH2_9BACT|nr:universal stress protein [Desulfocicer vacuolatum]SMD00835.1 Nucleotide-binding universal stress protein, UspA family [Desulfocicer vacuolatum DSM 3385]
MKGDFKKILFATDLTNNCRHAFAYAANLATRYEGAITLLHVMESVPESLDSRLKGLLGKEQWELLHTKHAHDARATLIGKKNELSTIHQALGTFSDTAQNEEYRYVVENILVKDGHVVDTILETAQEEECDLIILGSNKTIFSDSKSLGSRTKSILKRSRIPVMMIPPADDES